MEYKFVLRWNQYIHGTLNRKHNVGSNRVMPDLNNFIVASNRNHHLGAKMKKDYMSFASDEIRKQLPKLHITSRVRIHYQHYEADKRRDPSNVASMATKVIEDSLQECGVLDNDGWKNIAGYSQGFDIDKTNPRIEVTIREVESENEQLSFCFF